MDEQRKSYEKIPVEWIDRIFTRLKEIYGDKFMAKYGDPHIYELERTRWQSALIGCTAEEIKKVLELCRHRYIEDPPHCMEFWHYCKGIKLPRAEPVKQTPHFKETGEKYMKLIKDKLHGRHDENWQADISALDQQILDKYANQQNKRKDWHKD